MIIDKKSLTIQIIWIIAMGILIYFLYSNQNTKKVTVQNQTNIDISLEERCTEFAVKESNKIEKFLTETENPYLKISNGQIQQQKEDIKNKKYQECIFIWGD